MAGVETTNSSTAVAAALSPRACSSPVARTGSPPWTKIVRGPESDSGVVPSSPSAADQNHSSEVESSDEAGGNAGNKKPAWSKTPSPEGGAVVMGAELWPALSESTKASPKLSPSNSSKSLPDLGSPPAPQKPTTSNANHNVTPNHGRPTRQKSMKRDGGGNALANGGFSHQTPHNHNSPVKNSSGGGSESSGRDNNMMQNHGYRESGMRNPSGDHPHSRGSFRRGNGGPHSRGDGPHQNYGVRRGDQDRGGHDWNLQRNFNGRDAPLQPRVSPRGLVRPALGSAPFVHPGGPAPMRPFMNPMAMPDMPVFYFPPGPFMAPVPPPMYFPMPDPQLQAKIASQIDYYFSNENLVKDTYLRQNMDKDGWVPVSLIASFKKVVLLTDNISLILDAIRSNSTIVEVKGDKIRRRDDYMRWIMPPSMEFSTGSGTPSPKSPNIAGISVNIQSISLDDNSPNTSSMWRSSTGDSNSSSLANKDGPTSGSC